MLDFTQEKYGEICQAVKSYQTVTFSEYLAKTSQDQFLILRHDVDRMAPNALKMAQIESEYGLKATYYFRVPGTFNPELIKKIAKLGHEIGYHYECLDQAKGDFKLAIEIFEENLKKLRQYYPVKTICMHGNPLTGFDNRDLWKKYDYKNFDILGETYLSLGSDIVYFSDTGRTWSNKYKVKDIVVNKNYKQVQINTTDQLISLLKAKQYPQICLLTHPERWSKNWFEWLGYGTLDFLVCIVKKVWKK